MNWPELQRRLLLPVTGCVLSVGGYLATVRPADASLSTGYTAIWAARPSESVAPMLKALSLDPGSPERWADLAEAEHEAGRDADARYCLEQELSRAPGLPHVAMRAAGMYFRLNDPVAGLRLTNRVVNETDQYDPNVFQTWQRLGGTAEDVFELGVGSNIRAGRGYFRFLLDSGDPAATDAAWAVLDKEVMAGVKESSLFAKALTGLHEYERAARIESGILPNGVANGGFENEWKDQGLNWQVDSDQGVTVTRDSSVRHSGGASLRMEFDGSNRNEFTHVSQTRVISGGRWILRAMVRTALKDTATGTSPAVQGIGLRIMDGESGRMLTETPLVNAVHEWSPVEATLDAGSRARPIRIEIVRPAAPGSELTMTGMAWVDDVTLATVASK